MNARFFRYVQDAPWYQHFLTPVLESLESLPESARILDVGTGAGKLLEMGQLQYLYRWVGVDTSSEMLAEARQRPSLYNTELHQTQPDGLLPFDDSTFDAVIFCSVLFLIPEPDNLLAEAWRVLRPNGRLIVLTPSGTGQVTASVIREIGLNINNWTFPMWRQMTAGSGRAWSKRNLLADFATANRAAYVQSRVFGGLAWLEVVERVDESE